MTGFLRSFHDAGTSMQAPFGVTVVIPSMLRASLTAALHSVFMQRAPSRIQVLIGIDHAGDGPPPDIGVIEHACSKIPRNCLVQALYPGYSTSVRHGGLSASRDGGSLRTVLTHLANAPYVAYLDDDNWWTPDHLGNLGLAIERTNADYAYSKRWFAHHDTGRAVAIDSWESVGPWQGIYAEYGGFVDPNTLMIDRERCRDTIVAWTTPVPGDVKAMSADRMVFERLRSLTGVSVPDATAFYRLNPSDGMHSFRLQMMGGAYDQPG